MGRTIGILTPFLWTTPNGVNRQMAALESGLRRAATASLSSLRAPTGPPMADARRRVQAVLTGERETVFLPGEPYPRYFFAGATYAVRQSRSLKLIAAPADLIANIDVLLEAEDLDLLHLNEPFVPGLGWTALRHASCPLVATFHANPERLAPFWTSTPKLRRLFDSLDAAIASSRAARDVAAITFPGAYRIIPPGVDLERFSPNAGHGPAAEAGEAPPAGDGETPTAGGAPASGAEEAPRPLRLLFAGAESRRKGLGVLLRALRYLDDRAADLVIDVCGADRQERRYARLVPVPFAARVVFHGRVAEAAMPALYRDADVYCAPSIGPETASVALLEAMACGAVVAASRLPGYDEVVRHGSNGLLVPPRKPRALAAALRRLLDDRELRLRLAEQGLKTVRRYGWDHVAAEIESVYEEVAVRRRQPLPRRRRQQRELFADFHIHSHHSKDCVMPVADILERAREVGLDVVAITDHDSAAGGLEAREIAERYGVRVIVGEEVKSSQGEVIGLFLEETIPGGLHVRRDRGGHQRAGRHRLRAASVRSPAHHREPPGATRQRGRYRRARGVQFAPRLSRVQRAGRQVRAALPHPGGGGQRLACAPRHRHGALRH